MSNLPRQYQFLNNPNMPRMIKEGLKTYGTIEKAGSANNPTILAWARETGLGRIYTADSIPWCGLWAAVVAQRAGYTVPKDPLWALNWGTFGKHISKGPKPNAPSIGDVLVFTRNGGGHVGLYVGHDATHFHVLGGNQSDAVNIKRIAKSRLYTCRRPDWRVGQPSTVKPVVLSSSGAAVSRNER